MNSAPSPELGSHLLKSILHSFQSSKALGDKALAQLKPEEWTQEIAPDTNSIAVIIQHLYGNKVSRFTDFLTTDGEKPNRNRDAEFEAQKLTNEQLLQQWEAGWKVVLTTVKSLTPEDLLATVTIRQQPHTVLEALQRQVAHYSYHVGQMVFLGKCFRQQEWQTLSIARGASNAFNQTMGAQYRSV